MAIREERLRIAPDHVHAFKILHIPLLVTQDKDNLCWAACTASILSYYGKLNGEKLCNVVMKMKELSSCCLPAPAGSAAAWKVQESCNKTIEVAHVQPRWLEKYQLNSVFLPGPLTCKQVVDEINNHRRPLMIKVDTLVQTKHVILIYGWQEGGNNPISGCPYKLRIFNPVDGARKFVNYDYLSTIWRGTWWQLPEGPA